MSQSEGVFSVTGVAGGQLDDEGQAVLLSFVGADGPVRLVLPADQLPALLSVCVGLMGQGLPAAGEAEHPTIPAADWRVGVTMSQGVVLALAPEPGGALAFRLTSEQAGGVAAALRRAAALLQADESAPRQARGGH